MNLLKRQIDVVQGRVVGVNTAIFTNTGTSAGVGFAIPIDIVRSVVPQLIQYGKVVRPALNIQVTTATSPPPPPPPPSSLLPPLFLPLLLLTLLLFPLISRAAQHAHRLTHCCTCVLSFWVGHSSLIEQTGSSTWPASQRPGTLRTTVPCCRILNIVHSFGGAPVLQADVASCCV